MNSNKGFTVVEILVVVAVVALVGLLGWTLYSNTQPGGDASKVTSSGNTTGDTTVPEVKNKEDLQDAEDAVRAIDVDSAVNTTDIEASLE